MDKRLKTLLDHIGDEVNLLHQAKLKLEVLELFKHQTERIEELEKTLEFYADKKTYKLGVVISMGSAHPRDKPIEYDKGEKARKTLGE